MADIWNYLNLYLPVFYLRSFIHPDLTRWRSVIPSSPFSSGVSPNAISIHEFPFSLLLTPLLASVGLWYIMTLSLQSNHDLNLSSTPTLELHREKRNALAVWKQRKPTLTKRVIIVIAALSSSIIVVALVLGLGLGLGLHHPPKATPVYSVVDLGYAQYQGFNASGVSQWLGMRYAATPTGKLRFAAPAPPQKQKEVQSATKVRA